MWVCICVQVLYTATENTVKYHENTKGTINSTFAMHYFITTPEKRVRESTAYIRKPVLLNYFILCQ